MSKETVYDNEINPLMAQIIAICDRHGIAFAAQYDLDSDDDGEPLYCTTVLSGESDQIRAVGKVMRDSPQFAVFTVFSAPKGGQ